MTPTELDATARDIVIYYDGLDPRDRGVPIANWLPDDRNAENRIRQRLGAHRLRPMAIVREHRERWRRLFVEACMDAPSKAGRQAIADAFGVTLSYTYQYLGPQLRKPAGSWLDRCEAARAALGPGRHTMTAVAEAMGMSRNWIRPRLRALGGEALPCWMRVERSGTRVVVVFARGEGSTVAGLVGGAWVEVQR